MDKDNIYLSSTKEQITQCIRCIMNNHIVELIESLEKINNIIFRIKNLPPLQKKSQPNILIMSYCLILFRERREDFDYISSLKKYIQYKFPNDKSFIDEIFLDRLCRFVKLVNVNKVVPEMIGDKRNDYDEIINQLTIK